MYMCGSNKTQLQWCLHCYRSMWKHAWTAEASPLPSHHKIFQDFLKKKAPRIVVVKTRHALTWILMVSSPFYCLCIHTSLIKMVYHIEYCHMYICCWYVEIDFPKTEQLVWDFHQDVLQDNKRHVSCSLSFMWGTKKHTLLSYEILWVVKGFPFHVRFKQTGAGFFLGSNALWGAKPASNTDWKNAQKGSKKYITQKVCWGHVCPFKVSTINTGKFGSKNCLYSSRTASALDLTATVGRFSHGYVGSSGRGKISGQVFGSQGITGWWLNQPIWKILVKLDHFHR